jgi:hypothetical protein
MNSITALNTTQTFTLDSHIFFTATCTLSFFVCTLVELANDCRVHCGQILLLLPIIGSGVLYGLFYKNLTMLQEMMKESWYLHGSYFLLIIVASIIWNTTRYLVMNSAVYFNRDVQSQKMAVSHEISLTSFFTGIAINISTIVLASVCHLGLGSVNFSYGMLTFVYIQVFSLLFELSLLNDNRIIKNLEKRFTKHNHESLASGDLKSKGLDVILWTSGLIHLNIVPFSLYYICAAMKLIDQSLFTISESNRACALFCLTVALNFISTHFGKILIAGSKIREIEHFVTQFLILIIAITIFQYYISFLGSLIYGICAKISKLFAK